MLSIDDNFLEQLGLGSLPAEDKPSMRGDRRHEQSCRTREYGLGYTRSNRKEH